MLKRVLAWIILAGFVLLLLNIAIFHFYLQACIAVYVVIVIFFILSSGKIVPSGAETENNRFAARDGGGADADVDAEADIDTDGKTGTGTPNTAEGVVDKDDDSKGAGKETGKGKE